MKPPISHGSLARNAVMRRRPIIFVAPVAALLAVLVIAAPADAVGYWNLPGSFCQCMGCGWGAGYHAQFVLGPITMDDCCAHNEVRLRHAPTPPYGCYSGCACAYSQPPMMAPAKLPPGPPAAARPQQAPTRIIFDPPVKP